MTTDSQTVDVPISEAALRLRMSRERLIRAIQSGTIAGRQIAGRWHADGEALEQAVAAQKKAARRGA